MNQLLAIFGPVPSGGTSILPAYVLLALGLFGLLSLPSELSKMESVKSQWPKVAFLVAVDLGFVLGGLVMLSKTS